MYIFILYCYKYLSSTKPLLLVSWGSSSCSGQAVGGRREGFPPWELRTLTDCPRLVLPRTNSTRVFVVCKQRVLLLQLVLCRERTSPGKSTSAAACEPVHSSVFWHKSSTKPSFFLSRRILNTKVWFESLQPQLCCTAGSCLCQKFQQMLAINSTFLCFLTKPFQWGIFLGVFSSKLKWVFQCISPLCHCHCLLTEYKTLDGMEHPEESWAGFPMAKEMPVWGHIHTSQ